MININNTTYNIETYNLTQEEVRELVEPIVYRWMWEFSSMGRKQTIEKRMQTLINEYVVNRRDSKLNELL
jgi:hypothetical protein